MEEFLNGLRRARAEYARKKTIGERFIVPREGEEGVDVLLYRPKINVKETLPVLFNLHGGAWIGGDAVLMESFCQKIADETFSKAREQLADFVAGKDYAAWLQKEAASLAETLGENARITARAADLPLLKNVELPAGTVLEADDSITLGGLKGANPAKGVAADDTLEARLEAQHDWFLENAGLEINI